MLSRYVILCVRGVGVGVGVGVVRVRVREERRSSKEEKEKNEKTSASTKLEVCLDKLSKMNVIYKNFRQIWYKTTQYPAKKPKKGG